jgi:hypothetical protein
VRIQDERTDRRRIDGRPSLPFILTRTAASLPFILTRTDGDLPRSLTFPLSSQGRRRRRPAAAGRLGRRPAAQPAAPVSYTPRPPPPPPHNTTQRATHKTHDGAQVWCVVCVVTAPSVVCGVCCHSAKCGVWHATESALPHPTPSLVLRNDGGICNLSKFTSLKSLAAAAAPRRRHRGGGGRECGDALEEELERQARVALALVDD